MPVRVTEEYLKRLTQESWAAGAKHGYGIGVRTMSLLYQERIAAATGTPPPDPKSWPEPVAPALTLKVPDLDPW